MNSITAAGRFDQAISGLSDRIREALDRLPHTAKAAASEVRLRAGAPAALTWAGMCWFPDGRGQLQNTPHRGLTVTKEDVEQSVVRMCAYSVHSHQEELRNGFITLAGGHRAGIAGTAVVSDGKVSSVRDVTSINLRVAREINGAADIIVKSVFAGGVCGLLITGAPSAGKTTVLRDLARQLSSGNAGHFLKVAVVDERCEIGAAHDGVPQNDLGPCCDLLSGYPKAEGILTAVRTLSPQVIICDEIGGEGEAAGMLDGVNCGVKIVAAAHASSLAELLGRRQVRRLLDSGVFDKIVRLGTAESPGEIVEIAEVGELLAQNCGYGTDSSLFGAGGAAGGVGAV